MTERNGRSSKRRRRTPTHGTKRLRRRMLRDDPHCFYCGKRIGERTSTVDHVVPRALGGLNEESNRVLSCRPCNQTKDYLPIEYVVCALPRGSGLLRIWELEELEALRMTENVSGFNYQALDGSKRKSARAHAKAIHDLLSRSSRNIVEIGKRLRKVREQLGGSEFQAWIKGEFRWSQSTASNYMRVANQFSGLDCLDRFQPTALYDFAKDAVPQAAVQEAIEAARAGETITYKRAREIIASHQALGTPAGETPPEPAPDPDAGSAVGDGRQTPPAPSRGTDDASPAPAGNGRTGAKRDVTTAALEDFRVGLQELTANLQTIVRSLDASERERLADELLGIAYQLRQSLHEQPQQPSRKKTGTKKATKKKAATKKTRPDGRQTKRTKKTGKKTSKAA